MLYWNYSFKLNFDCSVFLGIGFDYFGWENLRQETIGHNGQTYAVWKDLKTGNQWSAYGGNDGSFALYAFETEFQAKSAVNNWSSL